MCSFIQTSYPNTPGNSQWRDAGLLLDWKLRERKEDIVVGDDTAKIRLTIWENEIGTLHIDQSYELTAVTVREYCGVKFLSTSKD